MNAPKRAALLAAAGLVGSAALAAQVLSSGLVLTTIEPCRIVDTRLAGGKILPGAGENRTFNVVGTANFTTQGGKSGGCSIPGFATIPGIANPIPMVQAVVFNFTAVAPSGPGDIRAFPTDAVLVPTASVLNYSNVGGLNIANGIIIPVRQDLQGNDLEIQADVSAAHLVVDVVGYLTNVADSTGAVASLRNHGAGLGAVGIAGTPSGFGVAAAGLWGDSTSSLGVVGTSLNDVGVTGSSHKWIGVEGTSVDSLGVYGQTGSPSGIASGAAGVRGDSSAAPGVIGSSSAAAGVVGMSSSADGVYGQSPTWGVNGVSGLPSGRTIGAAGVWGDSNAGLGALGTSASSTGVAGISNTAVGVSGLSGVSSPLTVAVAGVWGDTNSAAAPGVVGTAGTGTAIRAQANGAGTTALEINNGALRSVGTVSPAFRFVVTSASLCNCCGGGNTSAVIDNPLLNGDPNAILIWSSADFNPPGNTYATGYQSVALGTCPAGRWFISRGGAVPVGAAFNMLVVNQ